MYSSDRTLLMGRSDGINGPLALGSLYHPMKTRMPKVLDLIPPSHLVIPYIHQVSFLQARISHLLIMLLVSLFSLGAQLLPDMVLYHPHGFLVLPYPFLQGLLSRIFIVCSKKKVYRQLWFTAKHDVMGGQTSSLMSGGVVGVGYLGQIMGPVFLFLWW